MVAGSNPAGGVGIGLEVRFFLLSLRTMLSLCFSSARLRSSPSVFWFVGYARSDGHAIRTHPRAGVTFRSDRRSLVRSSASSEADDRRKGGSPGALSARKTRPREIRRDRRRRGHRCWDHLVVAPLWVAFQANLGTLLRTCDAVGACIAVPDTIHYSTALRQGDTLGPKRVPCIHWIDTSKDRWIERQRGGGWRILAVELAEGAVALPRLEPARERTVILLGHEWHGVPEEDVDAADLCVEIPMIGQGASLNVAVAGSLVLYRLAGMA